MKSSESVVVVGGGIAGAFTAYFLARLGVAPVIVERGGLGAHASGHNPGGLNPLHGPGIPGSMEALAMASYRLHLEHQDEIHRLSAIDSAMAATTRVHIAMEETDVERLAAVREMYSTRPGFSARWLDRDALRALDPRVSRDAIRGLWTEGNARVDASCYVRAVAGAAVALGGRCLTGTVVGLDHEGGRATGVRVDTASIPCDGVVIASGPWVDGPAAWLGAPLPIAPVKGELLRVEAAPPIAHEFVWRDAAVYGRGHEALLGGTTERAGFDATPSDAGRASILARVHRFFPGLDGARVVRHTAALRPQTSDGLPIVGPVRGWDNVCVALGGGQKGMLFAAAMGRAAADLVVTGRTALAIEPWSPSRAGLASP